MNQFKYLLFILTYFCILAFCCKNIVTFIILLFLTASFLAEHVQTKIQLKSFDKILHKKMKKQREDFIYSLSHDVRIPVLAQLRALELINYEKFGKLNESQSEILKQTEQSAKCILNLLALMINTYNIENNSQKLFPEQFNVYETIITCIDELKTEAADKNVTLEYETADKNLYFYADKHEMKKVLMNLILASVLYSHAGDKILVKTAGINNKLRITLFCDGKKTYSFNSITNTQYSTIGESIRLHFCKKIIELHKGRILRCTSPIFAFELPLKKAAV